MHLVLCECKVSHDGASCMLSPAHSAQYIQQGKQYIYTLGLGFRIYTLLYTLHTVLARTR